MPTTSVKNSVLVLTAALGLSPQAGYGMGPKPPQDTTKPPTCDLPPSNPVANPIRRVILKPVTTMAFQLPNGSQVNLAADLNKILNTAVTETDRFSPMDPPSAENPAPCGNYLAIEAGVSTFEMSAFELGLTFGYSPTGPNPINTDINGRAKVRLGTVTMDFAVRNCVNGQCSTVAASTASAISAGVNLSTEIDFGDIETGPELLYNTPLSGAIRSIMVEGMKQVAASPHLNRLAWQTTVREVTPETGMVYLDAGSQDRLAPNQLFEIYAVTPSSGACNVYKVVAYVRTTQVNLSSSVAVIEKSLDPRGVQPGDIVRIRMAGTQ